jgi:tetratricopeptide (TPR) repeat protein
VTTKVTSRTPWTVADRRSPCTAKRITATGEANALNGLGWYHALTGDHHEAFGHCRQALAILQELTDVQGQAITWDSIGYAHDHLGQHAEAVICYQQAIELYQDAGDLLGTSDALRNLGDVYHSMDDHISARDAWTRALAILDELGYSGAEELRARLS